MTNTSPKRRPHRETLRAISYTRQSVDRDEESFSLDNQDELNRAYAEQQGYEVVETIKDPGVSALDLEMRHGLQRALQMIEDGEADVIIVWIWSRLARAGKDYYDIRYQVEQAGGFVESSTETNDDLGSDVHQMMNTEFSRNMSRRWREAQRRRVRQGLPPGGQIPFGYARVLDVDGGDHVCIAGLRVGDDQDRRFRCQLCDRVSKPRKDTAPIPHPVNGPIVKEIFDRYIRGQGPQLICKWLHEIGVTTMPKRRPIYDENRKRIGTEREPSTKPFGVDGVTRLMDSGFAAGFIKVHDPDCPAGKKRRAKDYHTKTCDQVLRPIDLRPPELRGPELAAPNGAQEPIIDIDTWETFKEQRRKRQRIQPKARHPKWFLGGGLTVCGECVHGGFDPAPLIVNTYIGPKSSAVCSRYRGSRACSGVSITRKHLEMAFALWWFPGHMEEIANQVEAKYGTSEDERSRIVKELDGVRAEEEKIDTGVRRLAGLVIDGTLSDEDVRAERAKAEQRRGELHTQARDLQARLDGLNPDADVYERLRNAMPEDMPAEEYNVLLRAIIKRIVVTEHEVIIEPRNGEPTTYGRNAVRTITSSYGHKNLDRDPGTGRFKPKAKTS